MFSIRRIGRFAPFALVSMLTTIVMGCTDTTGPNRPEAENTGPNSQISATRGTQITVINQPSTSAISGAAFAQQPAIQVRDAASHAVKQPGVKVTAAIATGGGTLGGNATVMTNAKGVATFTNLAIAGSTGARTLRFTAPSLSGATSGTIAIGAVNAAASTPSATAGGLYPNRPASFTQSSEIDFSQTIPSLPDNVDRPISGSGTWLEHDLLRVELEQDRSGWQRTGRGHWAPGSYGGGVIGQGGGHGIGNVFTYAASGTNRLYMSMRVYFDFDASLWHPISNKFVNLEV